MKISIFMMTAWAIAAYAVAPSLGLDPGAAAFTAMVGVAVGTVAYLASR